MSTTTWFLKRRGIVGLTFLLLGVSCDSKPPPPPPTTGCTINGMDYADMAVNPQQPCQTCQLSLNATAWTNLQDGLSCNQGNSVCTGGICKSGCFISGMFYAAPELDPANSCKICHPAETTLDWSDLPSGASCADGGICLGGSCQVGCFIQGQVYPDRSDNPGDPSQCCNQTADSSGWSTRLGAPTSYDLGATGVDIVAADFNGDGVADLAAIDQGHDWVSVFLSDGNGGFHPVQTFPVDSQPHALVAVDLDGDGKPDLVAKSLGLKTLDVLLNQGGGTFAAQKTFPAGTGGPGSMVVGDFDNDGKKDLLCSEIEDGVVYYPGLGNGDLAPGLPVLDAGGGEVASADFNADSALDVLNSAPDSDGGVLDLLGGIGDGGFISGGTYPPTFIPVDMVVGDADGDGALDIVISSAGILNLFVGNGGGFTIPPTPIPVSGTPGGLTFGDLTGTGKRPLLVSLGGISELGSVSVDGGAATLAVVPLATLGGSTSRMAVADFNGDGALDVAILSGTGISVFLNGCP